MEILVVAIALEHLLQGGVDWGGPPPLYYDDDGCYLYFPRLELISDAIYVCAILGRELRVLGG